MHENPNLVNIDLVRRFMIGNMNRSEFQYLQELLTDLEPTYKI